MSCDWLVLIPIVLLGALQLSEEGKLNIKGIIIEPIMRLLNILRK